MCLLFYEQKNDDDDDADAHIIQVTGDSSVLLSTSPQAIRRKYHQKYQYNLIRRSFTSKERTLLINAFITYVYVRPVLEYNYPVWSPTRKKEINHNHKRPRRGDLQNGSPTCRVYRINQD